MTDELFGPRHGAPVEDEKPRKSRGKKIGIIVLSSLLVLMLAGAATAFFYLNSLRNAYEESVHTLDPEETFPEERPERPTRTEVDEDGNEVEVEDQQLNILLIGYDVGGGSGESENLAWVPNAGRADTMMWIHIPHERDSVQVMSIMRDTWVTIPGHGEHKINAAFSLGGTATAVHTLESLFGVRIDHVAAVNMYGFQDIVSTLGGVTVNSPVAFTSRDGYQYHGGPQYMNASEALSFVRERRAFDGGDYQRVANQQAFVRGVIGEVLTPGTLANPARVHNLVSGFSPYMTVDQGLGDADYLAEIGWDMRNVRNSDIEFFTLPNNGIGSAGGQSVIWPNYGAIAEAGEAMREGWFDEYASQR